VCVQEDCDVMLRSLVEMCRRLGVTHCLKMNASGVLETAVRFYWSTRYYILGHIVGERHLLYLWLYIES
jgi:hypothetical protein